MGGRGVEGREWGVGGERGWEGGGGRGEGEGREREWVWVWVVVGEEGEEVLEGVCWCVWCVWEEVEWVLLPFAFLVRVVSVARLRLRCFLNGNALVLQSFVRTVPLPDVSRSLILELLESFDARLFSNSGFCFYFCHVHWHGESMSRLRSLALRLARSA